MITPQVFIIEKLPVKSTQIFDFKLSLEAWSNEHERTITAHIDYIYVHHAYTHPENKILVEIALENYLSFGLTTGTITQDCYIGNGQTENVNWFYTMTHIREVVSI